MKFLLIIFTALVLASCSEKEEKSSYSRSRAVPQTLAHKAYYYHGLGEVKDRELIKSIMGIDPVTVQWCAAFVNMILLENLYPTSESVSDYYLTARSFLTYGQEVKDPRQGDIIVFPRGDQGWQGHVGFYVSTTIKNNTEYYNIIGGNQGDSVSIKPFLSSSALSIRRVN
jgi:uncharacterized protein (TIGR02594 family)|tara:strand:+ start:1937 stop:2446 length:510 start_codon:yes stop_codon:yes gene_type:complete